MKGLNTQRALTRSAGLLRRANGRAAGFTLVEMLVAVGAVAFVAVGIASIFGSVGDTVSRGRSLSAITQYAAVLERQMRDDFANMTREGYLIIRHEQADGGNNVPLFAGQSLSEQRPRRIDEIMFFVNESSQSAREALVPGFVPEGSSARIYYGMGQRLTLDEDEQSQYAQPDITDRNRSGVEERLGAGTSLNPNRFAAEWTLLRHETALVAPGGGLGEDPGIAGVAQDEWRDNRLQIGLQPAAESIFQSINLVDVSPCPGVFPSVETVRSAILSGTADPDESPLFESGLIDVATTSLEEIRAIVQASPGVVSGGAVDTFNYVSPFELEQDCGLYLGLEQLVGPIGVQQAWMLDGLPAASNEFRLTFDPAADTPIGAELPAYTRVAVPEDEITRIRYEPEPPNVFTALSLASTDPNESAIRLADQYALASSGFIPRVSEFIVEWSFGKLDDEGRLIWHGGEREIDVDNDGSADEFVYPYPRYQAEVRGTPEDRAGGFFVPYELFQPAQAGDPRIGNQPIEFDDAAPSLADAPETFTSGDIADAGDTYASYPVHPEVIHGVDAGGFTPPDTTTVSYFGFSLPYFNPDDPDGDGNTNDAALQETMAWPWPELIRVTVRLADPGDETIEQTFQYVFPTPGNPVR